MAEFFNFVVFILFSTLNTGILFSSFFAVNPRIQKGRLFLWIFLLAIPFYFINNISNTTVTGHARPLFNLATTMLFLFFIQLLFVGKAYQKGLVAVLFIVLTAISEWLVISFASFQLPMDELHQFVTIGRLSNQLCMLINLLLIGSLRYVRKKRNLSVQRNFTILQLLIALICVLSFSYLMTSSIVANRFLLRDILLMGSYILLTVLFYAGFEIADSLYHKNQEYQLQEQRHELLTEYYQQVEKHQQEVRKIRHDLKNQLYSIAGYLENDKEANANQQINELIRKLESDETPSFTQHVGLNALLRLHYQKIKQAKIICEFEIHCPETVGISDADLSSLIGNILDNAREACQHCEGRRYIQLKLVYFNQSLVISCENSTDCKVASFTTRKSDKANHGLGMQAIQQIVEKYHGSLNHTTDHYSFRLTCSLFPQT